MNRLTIPVEIIEAALADYRRNGQVRGNWRIRVTDERFRPDYTDKVKKLRYWNRQPNFVQQRVGECSAETATPEDNFVVLISLAAGQSRSRVRHSKPTAARSPQPLPL